MTQGVGGLSGAMTSLSSVAATQWERSPDALWRRTSTGIAVLPVDTAAALVFGGLAAALWEALSRPATLHALAEGLSAFLPDERGAAERTLQETVRFMVAAGVLRESVEPDPVAAGGDQRAPAVRGDEPVSGEVQ